jgi:hypothetical protein
MIDMVGPIRPRRCAVALLANTSAARRIESVRMVQLLARRARLCRDDYLT